MITGVSSLKFGDIKISKLVNLNNNYITNTQTVSFLQSPIPGQAKTVHQITENPKLHLSTKVADHISFYARRVGYIDKRGKFTPLSEPVKVDSFIKLPLSGNKVEGISACNRQSTNKIDKALETITEEAIVVKKPHSSLDILNSPWILAGT